MPGKNTPESIRLCACSGPKVTPLRYASLQEAAPPAGATSMALPDHLETFIDELHGLRSQQVNGNAPSQLLRVLRPRWTLPESHEGGKTFLLRTSRGQRYSSG